MAQSRESGPNDQSIGNRASDLGAWDKLQLGWLDYETVLPSQNRTHRPRPARVQLRQGAGRRRRAAEEAGHLASWSRRTPGTKSWWSGTGDDYTATMSRSVTLPTGTPTLTFQANYNIESGLRLRLRRGQRRLRLGQRPGHRHRPRREQRHHR